MFLFELNDAVAEYEDDLDARARAAGEPELPEDYEIPGEEPDYADILADLGLV